MVLGRLRRDGPKPSGHFPSSRPFIALSEVPIVILAEYSFTTLTIRRPVLRISVLYDFVFQFVTGTSRVPLGGFRELMGMRGPQQFSIHRYVSTS